LRHFTDLRSRIARFSGGFVVVTALAAAVVAVGLTLALGH